MRTTLTSPTSARWRYNFLFFSWALRLHPLHDLPGTWCFHFFHEAFLEVLGDDVQFLLRQLFISLNNGIFRFVDLVFRYFARASKTRSMVISTSRPFIVKCWSFFLEILDSLVFLHLHCFFRIHLHFHRNVVEVLDSILLCLP